MYVLAAPMFGGKHLVGLAFVVVLNVILYFVYRKYVTSERKFVVITLTLFYILEIVKLGYMVIRDGSFPMNHIPLHLCSIPLYAYLAWFIAKDGTWWNKAAKFTAYAVVMIAGITALIIPVNIIGSEPTWALVPANFLPYISFLFHGLMIFSGWYIIKVGYVKLTLRSAVDAILFTGILMIIAVIMNAITGSDFMLLNTGNGSPLVFLRDINQLLYSFSMILLGFIMITLTVWIGTLTTKETT